MNVCKRTLLAAALALMAGAAHAESRLIPPVEILDSTDPLALEIDGEQAQVWQLVVTRVLRDHAHELARDRQQLSFDQATPAAEGRAKVGLGIDRHDFAGLPDGVYVQRIVVDAIPRAATERIYHTQRAFYFRVSGGAIERIGMREYSDIAEPTYLTRAADGREQRVNAGGAVAEAGARNTEATPQFDVQIESGDDIATRAGTAVERAANASERD